MKEINLAYESNVVDQILTEAGKVMSNAMHIDYDFKNNEKNNALQVEVAKMLLSVWLERQK
jgi:hypothetical protein